MPSNQVVDQGSTRREVVRYDRLEHDYVRRVIKNGRPRISCGVLTDVRCDLGNRYVGNLPFLSSDLAEWTFTNRSLSELYRASPEHDVPDHRRYILHRLHDTEDTYGVSSALAMGVAAMELSVMR